jgi:hypothetical protein
MSGSMLCRWIGAAQIGRFAVALCSLTMTVSCTTAMGRGDAARLRQTASLIEDVKAFGKTLGIEPTEALRRTSQEAPTLSMFWLWMQREGTLALNGPVDVHLAIGFNSERESPKLEQVYRVERYSVYHRQGNEFADGRSVATVEFAEEPLVRRVKVVLHEDLHGDVNFALPWEVEEALVTPLGSLAAVAYFRHKGDEKNLENSLTSVREERQLARELTALVGEAEKIFAKEKIDDAKQKIIDLLPNYPTYRRRFERQTRDQHAPTAVEAKLSHDLAYYRFYDQVAELAEKAPSLGRLIADLQRLPKDATPVTTGRFLRGLLANYGAVTN